MVARLKLKGIDGRAPPGVPWKGTPKRVTAPSTAGPCCTTRCCSRVRLLGIAAPIGCQAFIATLLFDPSMSALPIIVKQNSPSVGLFTHQQGTCAGLRPSRDRLGVSPTGLSAISPLRLLGNVSWA
ncbi:hypothetical protein CBR_g48871 [Chara braunii]|uniref:Uncharacterized protein n=1 Tax=Chara braunii TaxID=69332 RepID=A0A388M3X3_CHABU|nr:hypothetical protein CBR_g48871 [Chara braunii]|eukprot:GBG89163.1 hypothetical protein CBR_g48871 [Chara braunii]